MKVKFCKDCKWSRESKTTKELRCVNPYVMAKDSYALSTVGEIVDDTSVEFNFGKSCWREREPRWFAVCGMKGKLWEQKMNDIPVWVQERCAEDLR